MMTEIMWWPTPEAFEDLEVEETETGFTLSAPDSTELADWLGYWNQDKEHHTFFEQEFTQVLRNYADSILEEHGETQAVSDEQSGDRSEAEEIGSGSLS